MYKHIAVMIIIIAFIVQCEPSGQKDAEVANSPSYSDTQRQSPIGICGLEGFTESREEHIIDEILEPFVVRQIKGTISNDQGGWQKDYVVLFEIRGMAKESQIMRTYTDENGKFTMKDIPEGRYCFKATVTGWQSVMGIIFVDRKADPKKQITFKMNLGV